MYSVSMGAHRGGHWCKCFRIRTMGLVGGYSLKNSVDIFVHRTGTRVEDVRFPAAEDDSNCLGGRTRKGSGAASTREKDRIVGSSGTCDSSYKRWPHFS